MMKSDIPMTTVMKKRRTIQELSDAERYELNELGQIANNLAGYELFASIRMSTATYEGTDFHWCLKRIDEVTGYVEPQISWTVPVHGIKKGHVMVIRGTGIV